MYRSLQVFVLSLLVGGCVLFASTSAFAGEPTEFIEKNANEVSDLLQQEESEQRHAQFSAKVDEVVDFRELASRALGSHWEERSDGEQQKFLDLLQELLEANYRDKLEGKVLGDDYEIDYQEEKTRDDVAVVKTVVEWDDGDESADYKLLQKDGGWIVFDIVVDDISLLETYREDYTEIIEKEGWDELIARMEKRAKKVREG
ncbi:MAG: MlaC/ttg2D family ABC transporter substrate-binding protein [Persicimonas sp.]